MNCFVTPEASPFAANWPKNPKFNCGWVWETLLVPGAEMDDPKTQIAASLFLLNGLFEGILELESPRDAPRKGILNQVPPNPIQRGSWMEVPWKRVPRPHGDGDGQSPTLLQNRFTHQKKKKIK